MKNFFALISLLFISGCLGGMETSPPSVFVPKINQSSDVDLSPEEQLSEKEKTPDSENSEVVSTLMKNDIEYKLLEYHRYAYPENDKRSEEEKAKHLEYRIYGNNIRGCGEGLGLCIFEVWKGDEKIFYIEEGAPGQIESDFGGIPLGWISDFQIAFIKKDEISTAHRIFYNELDIYAKNFSQYRKVVLWKNPEKSEKNTIFTITIGGTQYFFDPFNSSSFKAYRVINPAKDFYVRSNGPENLSYIDQVLITDKTVVSYETKRAGGMFFLFTDENTKKLYEFTSRGGFELKEETELEKTEKTEKTEKDEEDEE